MNGKIGHCFFALAFLIAAPLVGLSCASAKKDADVPPAAVQSTADTQNSGEAVPAAPPSAPATPPKKRLAAARMVCELGNEKRTVVYRMKGPGCQVTYTKFGHSKVAAESPDGIQHCDNVFDRIKHNLTAAGYACRETD